MENLVPLSLVGFLVIMSGCTTSGTGNVQQFSTACEDCTCLTQEELCTSQNLVPSLKQGVLENRLMFPEQRVTCYYYCVTEEVLQKQKQDPANWRIKCTVQDSKNFSNNDFTFPTALEFNKRDIQLQVIYPRGSDIRIRSVKGKGDFGGDAFLQGESDPQMNTLHFMYWNGITNLKAGQSVQNGVIEFEYTKNGEQKTFSSLCTSNV